MYSLKERHYDSARLSNYDEHVYMYTYTYMYMYVCCFWCTVDTSITLPENLFCLTCFCLRLAKAIQKEMFNPNSTDNKGSCWILKDFYCSVTMLRELGLILFEFHRIAVWQIFVKKKEKEK